MRVFSKLLDLLGFLDSLYFRFLNVLPLGTECIEAGVTYLYKSFNDKRQLVRGTGSRPASFTPIFLPPPSPSPCFLCIVGNIYGHCVLDVSECSTRGKQVSPGSAAPGHGQSL
jgi:hypothetical protein